MGRTRLIADIGGTNARFAVAEDGHYDAVIGLIASDYPSFEAAIEAYLRQAGLTERPREAAFAVAAPISGDAIALTNHSWSFSRSSLSRHCGFESLWLVNDFVANAMAIPHLTGDDIDPVGGGRPEPSVPKGIIGPGTGLGVATLIPDGRGDWIPVAGEGGHVTMAPANGRESRVLDVLRRRFDHVSAERLLSGDGLVHLYETLCEIDGVHSAAYKPAQVTDETICATDLHCREAVGMFCAMLGTVAGNLAVTVGARGGIYIAGGIVPKLGRRFHDSAFRAQFEAKGRFKDYLAPIPTSVIIHRQPALLGLAKQDFTIQSIR